MGKVPSKPPQNVFNQRGGFVRILVSASSGRRAGACERSRGRGRRGGWCRRGRGRRRSRAAGSESKRSAGGRGEEGKEEGQKEDCCNETRVGGGTGASSSWCWPHSLCCACCGVGIRGEGACRSRCCIASVQFKSRCVLRFERREREEAGFPEANVAADQAHAAHHTLQQCVYGRLDVLQALVWSLLVVACAVFIVVTRVLVKSDTV